LVVALCALAGPWALPVVGVFRRVDHDLAVLHADLQAAVRTLRSRHAAPLVYEIMELGVTPRRESNLFELLLVDTPIAPRLTRAQCPRQGHKGFPQCIEVNVKAVVEDAGVARRLG
jgi:hypothetical protein